MFQSKVLPHYNIPDMLWYYDALNFLRLMEGWTNKEDRPASGSLVQLLTEAGVTKLVFA